jgi:NADPH2:quinone reductase
MKAIVQHEVGTPDVLRVEEVPEPSPGEHDLLVRVHATSVNPVDTKVRRSPNVLREFPLILGFDVSGVVVGVGPKAEGFRVGDEVYAAPNLFRPGANAEVVAVDARTAALKPRTLDHADAAVVPLVAVTAWAALHTRARVEAGQTVLIHAGAGGVGHIGVQLAKLFGCRVITTASRAESIEFCASLGADHVINYRSEDFVQRTLDLTNGEGAPVILDFVGGDVLSRSVDCLATNGQLVTILGADTAGSAQKMLYKGATLHYEFMGIPTWRNIRPETQGAVLRNVADLIDRGRLRPHIFRCFALEQVADAHRLLETGHVTGKISIVVRE